MRKNYIFDGLQATRILRTLNKKGLSIGRCFTESFTYIPDLNGCTQVQLDVISNPECRHVIFKHIPTLEELYIMVSEDNHRFDIDTNKDLYEVYKSLFGITIKDYTQDWCVDYTEFRTCKAFIDFFADKTICNISQID